MDGAGPQWGRKDGPPDPYLGPLNPHGSPFFFGFQKPFLFPAGKKKWSLNRLPRPSTSQDGNGHRRGLARNQGAPGKRAALFWGEEGQGSEARPGRQAGVSGADFAPTTSRPTNSTAQGRVWEAAPRGNEHPDGGVNHTLSPPLIRHLLRKCHLPPLGGRSWRAESTRPTFLPPRRPECSPVLS